MCIILPWISKESNTLGLCFCITPVRNVGKPSFEYNASSKITGSVLTLKNQLVEYSKKIDGLYSVKTSL